MPRSIRWLITKLINSTGSTVVRVHPARWFPGDVHLARLARPERQAGSARPRTAWRPPPSHRARPTHAAPVMSPPTPSTTTRQRGGRRAPRSSQASICRTTWVAYSTSPRSSSTPARAPVTTPRLCALRAPGRSDLGQPRRCRRGQRSADDDQRAAAGDPVPAGGGHCLLAQLVERCRSTPQQVKTTERAELARDDPGL